MPNIPVKNCCGCTACYNICPKSAIQMSPDSEGFLYPDVDEAKCIGCGACEKVCPIVHQPTLHEAYADCVVAQSNSNDVLDESTSGGFIDALYKYVLDECGGYAVGVAYNHEFLPIHVITDSYEKAKEFRNSKYAQSDLSNVFKSIRELLVKGKRVMFVGTPCQVAGLKTFLSKEYENLITVDLVCRSIPSPKLWRKYLDWQEERHNAKITKVVCRKKTYGYHSGALEIEFENGKHYAGSNRVDYYMKSFHHDLCSRPSCYDCQFKTKHRCSDFTVFACWRPGLVTSPAVSDNDKGYSNVLVHTAKGKFILHSMKNVNLYESDDEKLFTVMGSMATVSIKPKKERETFYNDIDRLGFYKTVKRYSKVSLKDRAIEAVKPIRYFLKTHSFRIHK